MQIKTQTGILNPLPANDNEPLPPRRQRPRARRCLQCGGTFRSEGDFHRICDACKTEGAWQTGADMTLELPPREQIAG